MSKHGIFISVAEDQEGKSPKIVTNEFPFPVTDYYLQLALHEIEADYGDVVSVYQKHKRLVKYGQNDMVGTSYATIQTFANSETEEVYQTSNTIDTISSDDATDATEIALEGHTIDGNGDFTFVAQTATVNGQNKVTLSTPLARLTRMKNTGSTELNGSVYGYRDTVVMGGVPIDTSTVHCIIPIGFQQSRKASATISKNDYWIINNWGVHVLKKTAGYADFELEIREKGGVFRSQLDLSASAGSGVTDHDFLPYLIVRPNSDVRVVAQADSANTPCASHIQGVLGLIVG